MRQASGSARVVMACVALLGGVLVVPAVGQQRSPQVIDPRTVVAVPPQTVDPRTVVVTPTPSPPRVVRPDLQDLVVSRPPPPPPPQPARFTLQAPDRTVEAGQRFALTIARQGHDGQAHDFALEYAPASLLANPPTRTTVADSQENGRVSLVTVADPPGDGPHTLRVTLVPVIPGAALARNLGVSAVDLTVTEPRPPARFSLRAPGSVQAGQAFTVTVARASRDGRAHDFRLAFEPEELVVNPPDGLSVVDSQASGSVRVATRADPAGDGPHPLRVVLRPGRSRPDIDDGVAQVSVNEPPQPRFSLRGPGSVEAGEAFAVTIVRDRSDGRAHDFRLAFDPGGLIVNAPGTVTVPDGRNGTVRLVTRPDPAGEGPHPLRITLVPGTSGPRLGVPRTVEMSVTERAPARFALRVPARAEAGERIPIEVVREASDGRDHGFSLTFAPAGLVRDPPGAVTVRSGESGWRRVVELADDPPGDGPYRLMVTLQPNPGQPGLAGDRAVVAVSDPPAPVDVATGEPTEAATAAPTPDATETAAGEATASATAGASGEAEEVAAQAGADSGGAEDISILRIARDNWPWGVLLLAVLGWLVLRRKPDPVPPPITGETEPAVVTPPLPGLRSEFAITPGLSSLPGGEPALRGPAIAVRVHTFAGKGECPDPLPLRETADV